MLMAIFKTMWLRLWRDKGALVLAFILPGFIFAIFAAIFSNASGGSLDLRVAIVNQSLSPSSTAFFENFVKTSDMSISTHKTWTEASLRERVRLGQDDVGIVITGDIANANQAHGNQPVFDIIQDPSRKVAATVLMGQIRQILAGGPHQQNPVLFNITSALPHNTDDVIADQSITYYIGATAILFLLFSAMQGAVITLDERKSGISDRLLVGPIGAMKILAGKFFFLTLIGLLQAVVILLVAALFFKVDITAHFPVLLLACAGSAALASSIALIVSSLSGSAAQMNTVSTFIVLLFSAVGGSMVPRFMMPIWLQDIGVFTPNYWAIEAFYGILARGQTATDLLVVWCVLFGSAIIGWLLAAIIAHKMMRV